MLSPHRRILAALATTIPLFIFAVSATGSAAAVTPAPDGLSGTWQVSRTCLTVCVSPKPVRKVVSHLQGDVFITGSHPRQVLYRMGMQVLVHGPKDSLLLAIKTPGLLMSGFGVGADGSTFQTTWRCVAPQGTTAAATTTVTATNTTTATNTITAAAITMGASLDHSWTLRGPALALETPAANWPPAWTGRMPALPGTALAASRIMQASGAQPHLLPMAIVRC